MSKSMYKRLNREKDRVQDDERLEKRENERLMRDKAENSRRVHIFFGRSEEELDEIADKIINEEGENQ